MKERHLVSKIELDLISRKEVARYQGEVEVVCEVWEERDYGSMYTVITDSSDGRRMEIYKTAEDANNALLRIKKMYQNLKKAEGKADV